MGSYLPIINLILLLTQSITLFSLNRLVLPRYSENDKTNNKNISTPQLIIKHSITDSPSLEQF